MSITIDNVDVVGWEHAIRGMRNPKNSWSKSDSMYCDYSCDDCANFSVCNVNNAEYFKRFWEYDPANTSYAIGPNDHKLMSSLATGGPVHAKYRRMIVVYLDITAPLYWWKEFDTYRVGVEKNSCSTMHKIHAKEFEMGDFSVEHLINDEVVNFKHMDCCTPAGFMWFTVSLLNLYREKYLETKDKKYWWQMIQLLPSSYNQKRTVMLNYEALHNMYESRKNHKLDEWRTFCEWIESLPYSELITGKGAD